MGPARVPQPGPDAVGGAGSGGVVSAVVVDDSDVELDGAVVVEVVLGLGWRLVARELVVVRSPDAFDDPDDPDEQALRATKTTREVAATR